MYSLWCRVATTTRLYCTALLLRVPPSVSSWTTALRRLPWFKFHYLSRQSHAPVTQHIQRSRCAACPTTDNSPWASRQVLTAEAVAAAWPAKTDHHTAATQYWSANTAAALRCSDTLLSCMLDAVLHFVPVETQWRGGTGNSNRDSGTVQVGVVPAGNASNMHSTHYVGSLL
jgi:hypothetical protein